MTKLFLIYILSCFFATSFYDFSITDIEGNVINFSAFEGKKVLLVNTASNSSHVAQYQSLEQLYQKYKDSLVVIAIPSNSFGHDTDSNAQIKDFITSTYNTHFIIGEKTSVAGQDQSALFSWLTHIDQNGMMEGSVNGDFYKFLINSSGTLIGSFAPSVDPMSDDIQAAITQ